MKYIIIVICSLFLLPVYGQNSPLVEKRLSGKWISEDDKKAMIVFKDTTQQDFYAGELLSSNRYWIKKDSLVTKNLLSGEVFNYAIVGVTENHLTLMYSERGNILKFRKQKATKAGLAKKPVKN